MGCEFPASAIHHLMLTLVIATMASSSIKTLDEQLTNTSLSPIHQDTANTVISSILIVLSNSTLLRSPSTSI